MIRQLTTTKRRDKADPVGAHLKEGLPVEAPGGWRGRVEYVHAALNNVVCITDGEVPNDYLRGYRVFPRRTVTIDRGKAIVNSDSATQEHRGAVVDLKRARLGREWAVLD
jgi:hypothetical protein